MHTHTPTHIHTYIHIYMICICMSIYTHKLMLDFMCNQVVNVLLHIIFDLFFSFSSIISFVPCFFFVHFFSFSPLIYTFFFLFFFVILHFFFSSIKHSHHTPTYNQISQKPSKRRKSKEIKLIQLISFYYLHTEIG